MHFDIIERVLVLDYPEDAFDFVLASLVSNADITLIERVLEEVQPEHETYGAVGSNYDIASEFFPKMVSREATEWFMETLGLNEGDFPEALLE